MEPDTLGRAWAEINLKSLETNFKSLREYVNKDAGIMGIIKANAYGHGDLCVARQLLKLGIDSFGVSNVVEALRVRNAGIPSPILILGPTPEKLARKLSDKGIAQTVFSFENAQKLSEFAVASGANVRCHLKIETGMNRLGVKIVSDSDFERLLLLYSLPNLSFEGIFTHFSVADDCSPAGVKYTKAQFEEFVHVCERLKRSGINVGIRHCCNSAATINFPEMHLDMVRSGILLYGLTCKGFNLKDRDDFKPVMTLKSRITSIKEVASNEYVSYGNTYMTNQKSLIGVVAIGYADGLRRNLSNNISVLVKGQLVPGIGNICMDQMMIDLSNTKGVSIGDEVIVFGDNEACNANVMAEKLGTINWEIVCGVGKRVPRVHLIVCNAGEKAAKVYLKSED